MPFSGFSGRKKAAAAVDVLSAEADRELDDAAEACASLLRAREVFLFEISGSAIRRYGRFGPDSAGVARVGPPEVVDGDPLGSGIFRRGNAFVEPVTDAAGEVMGVLVVPRRLHEYRPPACQLGPVAALLRSTFEARRLRLDRKRLELSVQRSEHWLRQVGETVPTGVALVDGIGTIMELNSMLATICGEERLSIVGRDLRDLIHSDDRNALAEELARRAAGDRKRRETELRVVRASGELRTLRVRFSTLMNGKVVAGVCVSAQDVTDEQTREAQLRRVERFANIAPLLAGVCHELNNPLTSIKSFAELMLLDDRPEEDREALEIVRREAARAGRIVSDLRLVARRTRADGAAVSPLELNDLVRRQCDLLAEEFRRDDIEVCLELGEPLATLNGVVPQLERVVEQLLTNAAEAVRHVDRPRRIIAQTYGTDDSVSLRVADNGPGIAPGDVDRIFDPFWTTRANGDGTGLGLSLVYGIVAEHNGQVRVEPGWGSGATFTIDFPAVRDAGSLQREPAVQTPARTALWVLIVEDEAAIRFSVGRYLVRRGHEVCEAEEGERAMQLIGESDDSPFDIIVADLRMPGLGGNELYARLKEGGAGMEQRLIFITGDVDSPDVARLVEEAAVPVVLKPFELPEIALIIESQARILPPLHCGAA